MPPPDEPLVTAVRDGSRRLVAAVDAPARALGLAPGLTLAHAQALVPDLAVVEADPEADAAALARLAAWCLRYAPLVSADPPDGIFVEIAGAAHLFGGEAALLADLLGRLDGAGIAARAAVADTAGAAWAVARYGPDAIVAPGATAAALADLPVAALRLPAETVDALHRLGLERIGQLMAMPSSALTRRFGPAWRRRLDGALGKTPEPLRALVPPATVRRRLAFAEPISAPETLARVAARLCAELCADLARAELGARRLDLVFARVDQGAQAIRVGTARPSRDPAHLARLLTDRLGTVEPRFGIEEATLAASAVEPLPASQGRAALAGTEEGDPDLGPLVDLLRARLGAGRVYRQAPVESEIPERSVARIPALAPPRGATWPRAPQRPARLLDPPERVDVVALLPDYPPAAFVWRAGRRRVVRADGPERIAGEWWRSDDEAGWRDYYRVEDEEGRRYWLFRHAPAGEGGRWFLHGLFG